MTYKLLEFFREEQMKHGYVGCKCKQCQLDMANAMNRYYLGIMKDECRLKKEAVG